MSLDQEMKDLTDAEVKQVNKQVSEYVRGGGQVGNGFIKNLINKIKKKRKAVTKKVIDTGKKLAVKGIEKAAGCKNKKTGDPYDYKRLPNESKHQLFLMDGCTYSAKWSGAGTIVVPKIKSLWSKYNGNVAAMVARPNFVNPIDRQAMAHDLAYLIAGLEKKDNKALHDKMIRTADERFVKRLKKMSDKNALIPLNAMRAKILFEKGGGPVYSGSEKSTPEDIDHAKQLLAALQRSGEGKKKKKNDKYDALISAMQGRGVEPMTPTNEQVGNGCEIGKKLDKIIEMLEKMA
jgi:hypothetical protein